MDTLFLHDFNLQLVIGVYEWERSSTQTVRLDLDIGLPDRRAGQTDDIADAINYAEVAQEIRLMAAQRNFNLIETLAEQIAALVLERFGAPWIRVRATKPSVVRDAAQVGICIERGTAAG